MKRKRKQNSQREGERWEGEVGWVAYGGCVKFSSEWFKKGYEISYKSMGFHPVLWLPTWLLGGGWGLGMSALLDHHHSPRFHNQPSHVPQQSTYALNVFICQASGNLVLRNTSSALSINFHRSSGRGAKDPGS